MIILLIVSIGFESLFLQHGLNSMDEGWPLHAAMEMHDGKTLYDEVFWVFPPGHVLPAWIGFYLEPPGIIGARIIYAAFNVALCLALFFVARKMMPDDFALLAGLLVAISAPLSHSMHLLFGYRYLALSVLVLLLFHRRLTSDDSRWMFVAGIVAGIALFFRITPAFAVSVAVGVGLVAATRSWQRWLSDGLLYSAGLILVWIPVLLWFSGTVGLETFWSEMIVRPVEMTDLQSKPLPPLAIKLVDRYAISHAFASLGFRLYLLMFFGFSLVLFYKWARSIWTRRPFDQVFLLTFVVFGGVYFVRSLGRSDLPHLDSAIPPVVVMLAYCASLSTKLPIFRLDDGGRRAAGLKWTLIVVIIGLWAFLNSSERFLDRGMMMGRVPLKITSGTIKVGPRSRMKTWDNLIPIIREHSEPDETIMVMTNEPLFYVLAERHSPGYFDVVMPGTFRNPAEEQRFLERLKASPPAVVVWPRRHFDDMVSRGLVQTAPRLVEWFKENYRPVGGTSLHAVLVPIAKRVSD